MDMPTASAATPTRAPRQDTTAPSYAHLPPRIRSCTLLPGWAGLREIRPCSPFAVASPLRTLGRLTLT